MEYLALLISALNLRGGDARSVSPSSQVQDLRSAEYFWEYSDFQMLKTQGLL